MRISSFSVDRADEWGEELEALLDESGQTIAPGSELERMCLAPAEILNYTKGERITSEDTYRQYLDTAALSELANRLLLARDHPCFETLLPHLALLNHGDPGQAGRGRETDQVARKLFELFVALMAMRFSPLVELEHPVRGSQRNPDVVLEFEGRRWGIACKVPTSSNRESLVQNLTRAVEQVVESGVDAGFPIFNLKNVIPPETFWRAEPDDPSGRTFVLFEDPQSLAEKAIASVNVLWQGVQDYVGVDVFQRVMTGPPCSPLVLSYLHVLAPVMHEDFTAATTSRFVACYHIGQHAQRDEVLIQALHSSAKQEWV